MDIGVWNRAWARLWCAFDRFIGIDRHWPSQVESETYFFHWRREEQANDHE